MTLVGCLVVPLVVSLTALIGKRYVPIGDDAAVLFRIRQVGTADSPLVGSYSTQGWAHPGPALFYLFAFPYRLTGSHDVLILVISACFNLGWIVLASFLVWRRRGLLVSVVFGAALSALLSGVDPNRLVRIWNPLVPLLPYFVFLVAVWCVMERDWPVLPLSAVLGSAIVQMHVAYLPLVAAGTVCAAVFLLTTRRDTSSYGSSPNVIGLTTAAIIMLWLLPMLNVVLGNNNASMVLKYFATPRADLTGLSNGLGLLSGHVKLAGPWTGGPEKIFGGEVQPETLWHLIGLALLLMALAIVLFRRHSLTAALPVVALGQLAAGGLAAGRIQHLLLDYLIVWTLPLAAFCWAAVGVAGLEILRSGRRTTPREWPSYLVASVLLAVILVETSRTTVAAARLTPPLQRWAPPVLAILDQLRPQLGSSSTPIRVETVGDFFNISSAGIIYGVGHTHANFYTSDGSAGRKWGSSHRWVGQQVQSTFTVVVTQEGEIDVNTPKCEGDPSQTRVAAWNQLSALQREEMNTLLLARYEAKGRLAPASSKRLAELAQNSFTIIVYKGKQVCAL